MYEQVHGTSIVMFYCQEHFTMFKKFFPFIAIRGSQFCQHGDHGIDWEMVFSLLVYLPDLASNVIYRLSKK